jgi:hypothetical protein
MVNTHLGRVNIRLGRVNIHLGRVNIRLVGVNIHLGRVNMHLGRVNTHLGRVNIHLGRVSTHPAAAPPDAAAYSCTLTTPSDPAACTTTTIIVNARSCRLPLVLWTGGCDSGGCGRVSAAGWCSAAAAFVQRAVTALRVWAPVLGVTAWSRGLYLRAFEHEALVDELGCVAERAHLRAPRVVAA